MRIGVLYSRVRPEEKLGHPELKIAQVTSRRLAGAFVHFTHPNLRGHTDLRYCTADELERCDLLFLCLPHGSAAGDIDIYSRLAPRIVDLSADFRLRSPSAYADWYAAPHPAPEWLDRFVYGLPELDRDAVAGASHTSGVGCNATATLLGLLPLLEPAVAERDLVDWRRGVVTELKVGSSEGGASSSDASHHPERSGAVRSFRPTGHRHTAEVEQALTMRGVEATGRVHLSVTSVEMVRGVLATSHLFLNQPDIGKPTERELFRAYRSFCRQQPFVRLVKDRRGIYRYPEPKIEALAAQAERLTYCPMNMSSQNRAEYVEALASVLPDSLDRVFLCNSGTEAVEGALKFAALVTGRCRTVALRNSFHGRTLGAQATMWNPIARKPYTGLLHDNVFVQPDPEAIEEAVDAKTAALILEPVQGEGGVNVLSDEVLLAARRACDRYGALLILDEVQTGFGRCGAWFAHRGTPGLEADLMPLAKGIGGGFPLGAIAYGERVAAAVRSTPRDRSPPSSRRPHASAATGRARTTCG